MNSILPEKCFNLGLSNQYLDLPGKLQVLKILNDFVYERKFKNIKKKLAIASCGVIKYCRRGIFAFYRLKK